MKKVTALLLCFFLLSGMTVSVNAKTLSNDDTVILVPANSYQENTYAKDGYFPFIYQEEDGWQFWRDFIGNCDSCVDGYLYVQNLKNGAVLCVLPERVSSYRSTVDWLYCITEQNVVKKVAYNGNKAEILYTAQYGGLSDMEYYKGYLFFVDGNSVIRLSLANGETTIAASHNGYSNFFPYATDKVILMTEDKKYCSVDMTSRTYTMLESEAEVDQLLMTSVTPISTDTYDIRSIPSGLTPVTLPLEEFEVGTNFTTVKNANDEYVPCPDGHAYCRSYAGGIQCLGFACYASDLFAHLTYDYNASGNWFAQRASCKYQGEEGEFTPLDNPDQLATLFAGMSPGAYVRLEWGSPVNWLTNNGHSFVVVEVYSDRVITYDCNVNNHCGISLENRTYNNIINWNGYDYLLNYVSHDFAEGIASYSSLYHYAECANCAGYCVAPHYTRNPVRNACDLCGYVGPIESIIP